jgi:hypothetical protein
MRPPGAIRCAVLNAAQALAAERGQGATWRDIGLRASVGLLAARRTVENMARVGALRPGGQVRVQHARRPMTLYLPATPTPAADPGASLDALLRNWTRHPAMESAGG